MPQQHKWFNVGCYLLPRSMMKFLKETFYYASADYIVDFPKEVIVENLNVLFLERKSVFSSPNLRGHFVDYPNSFVMQPKWSIAIIQNFERSSAYLKGSISETPDKKTKIKLLVRPNSVFGILFFSFFLFAIYNLIKFFSARNNLNVLYGALWIIFFGFPIIILIAKVSTYNLRKNFTNYLDTTA
jgi:hypothetical protein